MATLTKPKQGYTHSESVFDSSVITEVVYDSFDKKLFVFLTSGSIAGYKGVELEDYTKFLNADSVGQHWNAVVKKRFRGISSDVELVEREPVAETVVEPVAASPVTSESLLSTFKPGQVTRKYKVEVEVTAESVLEAVRTIENLRLTVTAVNPSNG